MTLGSASLTRTSAAPNHAHLVRDNSPRPCVALHILHPGWVIVLEMPLGLHLLQDYLVLAHRICLCSGPSVSGALIDLFGNL